MNTKSIFFGMVLLMLGVTAARAQYGFVSAGGSERNDSCSVSYSVGQVSVQREEDRPLWLTEGVQQAYEITVKGLPDDPNITLDAIVYPNPVDDELHLRIYNFEEGDDVYRVFLFDNASRLLLTQSLTSDHTVFHIGRFAPGQYYLQVDKHGRNQKTFKVVRR